MDPVSPPPLKVYKQLHWFFLGASRRPSLSKISKTLFLCFNDLLDVLCKTFKLPLKIHLSVWIIKVINSNVVVVVYFNQFLGAVHTQKLVETLYFTWDSSLLLKVLSYVKHVGASLLDQSIVCDGLVGTCFILVPKIFPCLHKWPLSCWSLTGGHFIPTRQKQYYHSSTFC